VWKEQGSETDQLCVSETMYLEVGEWGGGGEVIVQVPGPKRFAGVFLWEGKAGRRLETGNTRGRLVYKTGGDTRRGRWGRETCR
jgi:hypothetical protein